jgi:small subunit ribosomal protein S17
MARKKQEEEIIENPAAETGGAEGDIVPGSGEGAIDSPADVSEAKAAKKPESENVSSDADKPVRKGDRGNRAQKVGTVKSDKMQKTCVVRVDRLVKHPIYRRYVRRRSNFMAHNELGATTGDRVRIVETRPLSAHKRWRVVEIIQKAEK